VGVVVSVRNESLGFEFDSESERGGSRPPWSELRFIFAARRQTLSMHFFEKEMFGCREPLVTVGLRCLERVVRYLSVEGGNPQVDVVPKPQPSLVCVGHFAARDHFGGFVVLSVKCLA